jgi:hypothetical protein
MEKAFAADGPPTFPTPASDFPCSSVSGPRRTDPARWEIVS